jgi:molybdopterin-binding protein
LTTKRLGHVHKCAQPAPGVVVIKLGGVMAEVVVVVDDRDRLRRNPAERRDLGLAEGDEVTAIIKSTEVMLAT